MNTLQLILKDARATFTTVVGCFVAFAIFLKVRREGSADTQSPNKGSSKRVSVFNGKSLHSDEVWRQCGRNAVEIFKLPIRIG